MSKNSRKKVQIIVPPIGILDGIKGYYSEQAIKAYGLPSDVNEREYTNEQLNEFCKNNRVKKDTIHD